MIALGLGLGIPYAASATSSGPAYPGEPFGIVYTAWPASMTNSEITYDGENIVIAAGVGNDYRADLHSHARFNLAVYDGGTLRVWIEHYSGALGTVNLRTVGSDGTNDTAFTDDGEGRLVVERTIPAGGFSTVRPVFTSADASNPVVLSQLRYAIALDGATGEAADAAALRQWRAKSHVEAIGNRWPSEKSTLTASAAASATTGARVNGFTDLPGETKFALVKASWPAGAAPKFQYAFIRFADNNGGSTAVAHVMPMADHPGLFGGYVYINDALLDTATTYVEFTVGNANSGFYASQEVSVETIQLYDTPPTEFSSPLALSYADDHIIVDHAGEITMVSSPLFTGTGNEYLGMAIRDYDASGIGGGLGSVWRDMLYQRRVDDEAFASVRQYYQAGLNEFAILLTSDGGEFIGGFNHGYQARRAAPVMEIDTGSGYGAVNIATPAKYNCVGMRRTDYSEFYEYGTSNVAGILDTVKTFEPGQMTLYQRLEFVGAHDVYAAYLFKASFNRYLDGLSGLGNTFDTFTLPNDGDASYTPSSTNQAYDRYRMSGPLGIEADIEVTSGWTAPPAESFVTYDGNEIHPYFSPLGVHYSPFDNNGTSAQSVIDEQVVEMTTVMRWSKP